MNAASRYWQLVQIKSSGGCQIVEQTLAKTWLQAQFLLADQLNESDEYSLQRRLWQQWQDGDESADIALLCLRCFISHHIYRVCLQLTRQFGEAYGFRAEDLFPFVLDDDGQPIDSYEPFSLKILRTYDIERAGLATWTTRRVKHHSELDQFLQSHGLYRGSDCLDGCPIDVGDRGDKRRDSALTGQLPAEFR
ncbi:MAG: hypothetical protein F6K04_27700 [Leptolyngbya sp. SIO4C5]|nr:hypothetical protein [Leptolyngbya sp. SIO4C5]